jgi:hypothetical protein
VIQFLGRIFVENGVAPQNSNVNFAFWFLDCSDLKQQISVSNFKSYNIGTGTFCKS